MSQLTLFQLLTNKLGIAVIIISLLWSIADFADRIASNNDKISKLTEKPELTALHLPMLNANEVEKLSTSYLKYDQAKNEAPEKQQGMSLAEQAKQQGELKSLFIGDNKLQLKAVIKSNSENSKALHALILIKNVKTGEQSIEKYGQGSKVHGYQLAIAKNTQVILSKDNEQGQQEIILTMYSGK